MHSSGADEEEEEPDDNEGGNDEGGNDKMSQAEKDFCNNYDEENDVCLSCQA